MSSVNRDVSWFYEIQGAASPALQSLIQAHLREERLRKLAESVGLVVLFGTLAVLVFLFSLGFVNGG